MMTIETASGPKTVTLVHNDGHTNVATMFDEKARRVPAEDTLTVVPGFLGAYPNALLQGEAGGSAGVRRCGCAPR